MREEYINMGMSVQRTVQVLKLAAYGAARHLIRDSAVHPDQAVSLLVDPGWGTDGPGRRKGKRKNKVADLHLAERRDWLSFVS